MIVSIFLSLSHCALDIFAIGKQVNHIDEYRLEIPTNLQFLNFHGHEKPIKLAKMWNNKDRRKLKRNYKTLSKVKCTQISCKKTLILDVSTIDRSILGGNVIWDLKMTSTIERCPLLSVRYIKLLLLQSDRHFIRSWEKCPL